MFLFIVHQGDLDMFLLPSLLFGDMFCCLRKLLLKSGNESIPGGHTVLRPVANCAANVLNFRFHAARRARPARGKKVAPNIGMVALTVANALVHGPIDRDSGSGRGGPAILISERIGMDIGRVNPGMKLEHQGITGWASGPVQPRRGRAREDSLACPERAPRATNKTLLVTTLASSRAARQGQARCAAPPPGRT